MIQFQNHRLAEVLQAACQMPHFMIVLILYINLLNLSWIKKVSIFEEYGAFNIEEYFQKDYAHKVAQCFL